MGEFFSKGIFSYSPTLLLTNFKSENAQPEGPSVGAAARSFVGHERLIRFDRQHPVRCCERIGWDSIWFSEQSEAVRQATRHELAEPSLVQLRARIERVVNEILAEAPACPDSVLADVQNLDSVAAASGSASGGAACSSSRSGKGWSHGTSPDACSAPRLAQPIMLPPSQDC